MTRLLLRASKTPFRHLHDGPIPQGALAAVYHAQHRAGTKNAGNLVFAHSAYKVLDAPGVRIDVDDYELSLNDDYAREADRINETYDAFVLPMCNSFRPVYRGPLARMARTLRRIKIPCVVTGVGAQISLGGDFAELDGIRDEVRDFVGAVLDRSSGIGVRGEVTRDYLVHLGFPASQVDVIGCPSMFYNGEHMAVRKGGLGRIAFNYTPMTDPRILPFLDWFNAHPDGVTYVPQERDLMLPMSEGRRPDPDAPSSLDNPAPRLHQPDNVRFLCDVAPWIDFMRDQSFAIGTRIHGNIVALLADTPAHVICHDTRTAELSRYFEIPHTTIRQLDGFDARRTFERSDYRALNDNHAGRVATYARFLERNGLRHNLYDRDALRDHDERVRASLSHARLPRRPARSATVRRFQRWWDDPARQTAKLLARAGDRLRGAGRGGSNEPVRSEQP